MKHRWSRIGTSFIIFCLVLGISMDLIIPASETVLMADAGGPYEAYEGETITFDASNSSGPNGVPLHYRWDFDGDNLWDTNFSESPLATYMWNDDHAGTARVEVQASLGNGEAKVEILGFLDGFTFIYIDAQRAQSFLATFTVLTQVIVDVALNQAEIPNAPLTLCIRSDLDKSDLTCAEVQGDGMPKHIENWVVFDVPDISLSPGSTYYVVMYSNATNSIYEPHVTRDVYNDGVAWKRIPGETWESSPTVDLRMRILGLAGPLSATGEAGVTVHNLPPAIDVDSTSSIKAEGEPTYLNATATDQGSDDLSITWSWQMGPTEVSAFLNEGMSPFVVSDNSSHVYGDDGIYVVNVTVEDDDGGITSREIVVTVTNVAPSLSFAPVLSKDESEPLTLQVRATDPGSDDISFTWAGHCEGWPTTSVIYPNDPTVIPDPFPSPEVNPRNVTDTQIVVCGDNGIFSWSVQVEDDDGGLTTLKGTFQVGNLPPSLTVQPPLLLQKDEGVSVTLDATASDAGSDDLIFKWIWDYGPNETRVFYNDGIGPDPPDSPGGTRPFTVSDSSTHTYGDDCFCNVTLTVEDDDSGTLAYITSVEVLNLPPILVTDIKAYAIGDFALRVAGEKWHDAVLRLYDDGEEIANASVFRVPGSPDEQSVAIENVVIDLTDGNFSATVEYTPSDDPVNGQINGASPAWLIFRPHDGGEESRLHHTFNVKHPETWLWSVEDLNPLLVGVNISFEATASDAGSDDLTFAWDWGDGTSLSRTYYNDGTGPDPYPSPDVDPITVTDTQKHAFVSGGIYIIVLVTEDDDGGTVTAILDIILF